MMKTPFVLSALLSGLVFSLFVCGLPRIAHAQSGSTPADEISLFVGSHLPAQIDGVTEVLPVFGARYGLGTGPMGIIELGLSNTHAEGVDFTILDLSFRGNVPMDDGLVAIFYGGADLNYYTPQNETKRKFANGFHVGTGAMLKATNNLWFRGDLKFMGGPGASLFLLFGLVFQMNDSGSN